MDTPRWIEVENGRFRVENGRLLIDMEAPHSQVLPFFDSYDITQPNERAITKYSSAENCVGHQQRSLLVTYALKSFIETGGYPAIDAGSGGVMHPGAVSVDWIGAGEEPAYGGLYAGVNIKADASVLENFGSESFSCIMSNHLGEHFTCINCPVGLHWKEKLALNCPGYELASIIRGVWHRILRPKGYVVMVLPDEDVFRAAGTSSFAIDSTHNHAYGHSTFAERILSRVKDLFDVIQFDTFQNEFSFDVVLRKR